MYLDTSALVKLFIHEDYDDVTAAAVRASSRVAVSVVAYPEARSAFARQMREGKLDRMNHDRIVRALDQSWPGFHLVRVTYDISREAGELAERMELRGFDAIHLASAVRVYDRFGDTFRFLAFDERLNHAARQMMPVYEVE